MEGIGQSHRRDRHWPGCSVCAYPEDIETLAARYARKVVAYQGEPGGEKEKSSEPDYHRVDIDTIDNERSRSIGAEHVVYETIKTLGLPDLLMAMGLSKLAVDAAIGVIAARLIAPSSERATHLWLQDMTALDELLETDFSDISQYRVYTTLAFAEMQTKPLIVMDAGIAIQSNILWLKEKGYDYIVVSRKKTIDLPPETEMITVREDNRRLIRAALAKGPDDDEVTLHCHSTDKEVKERGIINRFESRFEGDLNKVKNALSKKHGTKRHDKVIEKIGRLKERHKRVARHYEITVTKDENTKRATAICS